MPAGVSDELVEQRILEAYAGGGTARCRHRLGGTAPARRRLLRRVGQRRRDPLPVPIAANGGRIDPRPGVLLTHDRIPADEVVLVHGMRCAIAERALFDEIRRLGRFEDQVVAADMAFGGELTSIHRMRRYRWARYWYRDVRRLDRCCRYARRARQIASRGRLPSASGSATSGGPTRWSTARCATWTAGSSASRTSSTSSAGSRASSPAPTIATCDQHEDDLGRADRFHGVGLRDRGGRAPRPRRRTPCSAADDSGRRACRPPAPALAAGSAHREPRQPRWTAVIVEIADTG